MEQGAVLPRIGQFGLLVAPSGFARGDRSLGARSLGVVGSALLALACAAPTTHVPEPWASDPEAAARLSARAVAACQASGGRGGVQPVRPFVTDGCSRFPDAEWNTRCCVEHDLAYWCGGTADERAAADAAFGECLDASAGGFMAGLMEMGVRLGGSPLFPSSYRWGYGHPYSGGYPSAEGKPDSD